MKQRGPSKASVTRGGNLAEKKHGEIFAFFWASIALLLFLCLWSYDPADTAFEVSRPNSPIKNYADITGAHIAFALNFVCGKASYFFVALLVFWSLAAWTGGRKSVPFKLFSGTVFFVSSCAMLSLLFAHDPATQLRQGGLIGFYLAHILREYFGNAALHIALTLFVLSVLVATEFLVFPIIAAAFHGIRALVLRAFPNLSELGMPKLPFGEKAKMSREAKAAAKKEDKENLFAREAAKLKIPQSPAPDVRPREAKSAPPGVKSRIQEDLLPPKKEIPREQPLIKTLLPMKPTPPKEPAAAPKPKAVETPLGDYKLPPMDLLRQPVANAALSTKEEIDHEARVLEQTLADFGIEARVVEVEQGPAITRFELQPAAGIKVQRISNLADNIALAMKATSVRIIAPIPGKSRVGIEVPNRATSVVTLREILMAPKFQESKTKMAIAIGKDTAGAPIIANMDQMPHLLIAGSTGSGKTVCVNAIITSLLYNATPEDVKFILIDPKMVELTGYNGLPHLLVPVVTEADKVPTALGWLVSEMERRYRTLSGEGVRNIIGYNEKIARQAQVPPANGAKDANAEPPKRKMPYIILIIDELADLMMAAGKEIESAIMRLAQLSRAVGIHLILATQRPSVDVITGVIKANFPARIAFQVASKVDSRTVLDMNGADALLGKGDLLFLDPALSKPVRAQGAYLSDEEIEKTVDFIKKQRKPVFDEEILKGAGRKQSGGNVDFRGDEYYDEACRIIVSSGQASVSMLQRRLGLGYTRAARLVDMMEEDGIVGPLRGSKGREILVDLQALDAKQKAAAAPPQPSQENKTEA